MKRPDTGSATKPEFLKKRARASKLWDELAPALRKLGTLRVETTYYLAQWCWLQSSFEEAPDAMPASKLAQMRLLATSLGMDPSGQTAEPEVDPNDEFFTGPHVVT